MGEYLVSFAGSTVSVHYDGGEVFEYLALLFADIPGSASPADDAPILTLGKYGSNGDYALASAEAILFRGSLGVRCAAVLYDAVIYLLLNRADGGVALHAGAVSHRGRVILLPGQSGSGKSTLTAWLTARGCSYLTDELIFVPDYDPPHIQFFSRPVCLKSAAVSAMKKLLKKEPPVNILEDRHGAIVPFRLLNRQFSDPCSPPDLMLLPEYEAGSSLAIEKMSAAKLCMSLMKCHVNARNLENHGFSQVVKLARSTPAYRIRYCRFAGLGGALDLIFDEGKGGE